MTTAEKLKTLKRDLKLLTGSKREDSRCLIIKKTPKNNKFLMELTNHNYIHVCNSLSITTATEYIRFVHRKRDMFKINKSAFVWWNNFKETYNFENIKIRRCSEITLIGKLLVPYLREIDLPLFEALPNYEDIDEQDIEEHIMYYLDM